MSWWRKESEHYRRRDDISPTEIAMTLERHMKECREDKAEIRRRLDSHSTDVNEKHEENLRRFSKIERTIYVAMGGGAVIVWLLTHASEIVPKIVK